MLIRLIPDYFIRKLCPITLVENQGLFSEPSQTTVSNGAIPSRMSMMSSLSLSIFMVVVSMLSDIRCEVRGLLVIVWRGQDPTALGPASVMAGIVVGSIAGWSPIERDVADDESTRLLS
jgi:hypothetical protein